MGSTATGSLEMTRRSTIHRRLAAGLVAAILAAGCGDVNAALEHLAEARQQASNLHVAFSRAVDASNRAVMADTDDRSAAYADDARASTQAVASGIDTLRPLLQGLGYTDELRTLDAFNTRFAAYQALDRTILDLAVQNTNLKAQSLSFGKAQQEADAVADALAEVAPADPARGRWHLEADAATAVAAVREIQALEAPHIANADDDVMASLEKRMTSAEARAHRAINAIGPLAASHSRPRLATAIAAFDRFIALNAEIAALSRRNTNVRSLALALDQRTKLASPCEESLQALESALAARHHTGGR